MSEVSKKDLSEADICDLFITPAIKDAGWDPIRQIRREVTLTPGPIVVRGNISSRNKKKKKFADYVLSWEPGVPVAVVEAKDNRCGVSHGMQHALGYAEILDVPSAFSSNGDAFASHNKVPYPGEEIETEFPLSQFPAPSALWRRYRKYRGIEEPAEALVVQPYHTDISGKEPRYYQVEAINRVVEAVARGQRRVLLVLATGTGKTYTTFQIIWRLWKAKAVRRVLFLVDRNILADQTPVNDFSSTLATIRFCSAAGSSAKIKLLTCFVEICGTPLLLPGSIDEILCDQLKDCLNETQTTQLQLADAIVELAVA